MEYTETSFWEFVYDNASQADLVQYLSTTEQSFKDDFEETWRADWEQIVEAETDDSAHKNWEFENSK